MVNDDKFIEIKQNWWHIEEIYSPNNARVIRQVMDIFTNESQIPIILTDKFVGLKVTARNSSNREIAFLEYSDSIILNLTDLNSFPSIPNELKDSNILYGYNSRHVRIEIEYISIDPKIGDLENEETLSKLKYKIWNKILPKRTSTIGLIRILQPEIDITLPLGWRMGGSNIFRKFFGYHKSKEGYSVGLKCIIQNKTDPLNEFNVDFYPPFIKTNNGKRTYNYFIYPHPKLKNESNNLRFEFSYQSQISYIMALISITPFIIFLPISLYTFIYHVLYLFEMPTFLTIMNSSIAIGISVLLLTFSIFDYNLIKEGYDIPHKYWHLIILLFSIAMFSLVVVMDINTQNLQNTNSMVTYFYKQLVIFI